MHVLAYCIIAALTAVIFVICGGSLLAAPVVASAVTLLTAGVVSLIPRG